MWFKKKGKHSQKKRHQEAEHPTSLNQNEDATTLEQGENVAGKDSVHKQVGQTGTNSKLEIKEAPKFPGINDIGIPSQPFHHDSNEIPSSPSQHASLQQQNTQSQNKGPARKLNIGTQNQDPLQAKDWGDQSNSSNTPYRQPENSNAGNIFSIFKNPIVAQTNEDGAQSKNQPNWQQDNLPGAKFLKKNAKQGMQPGTLGQSLGDQQGDQQFMQPGAQGQNQSSQQFMQPGAQGQNQSSQQFMQPGAQGQNQSSQQFMQPGAQGQNQSSQQFMQPGAQGQNQSSQQFMQPGSQFLNHGNQQSMQQGAQGQNQSSQQFLQPGAEGQNKGQQQFMQQGSQFQNLGNQHSMQPGAQGQNQSNEHSMQLGAQGQNLGNQQSIQQDSQFQNQSSQQGAHQSNQQSSQLQNQGSQQANDSGSQTQSQPVSQSDQSILTTLNVESQGHSAQVLKDSSDHASNQTSPLQTPGMEQPDHYDHISELTSNKANDAVSFFREVPVDQQEDNHITSSQVGAMNKGAGEALQSQSSGSNTNQAGQEEVSNPAESAAFINAVQEKTHHPADLVVRIVTEKISILYFENLIESNFLNEHILKYLQDTNRDEPESISENLSIPGVELATDLNKTVNSMLNGAVCIHLNGHSQIVLGKIPARESRGLSAPENESQVIGSQVGFNENLSTTISLIRRYIVNPNLANEKFRLGKQTNTSVSLLYIEGIAATEHVNTVRQRLSNLSIADLIDSASLIELIEDSSLSVFPQMLLTERPDRFCDGLLSGKVGIVVDGSSMAILAPVSFIEYFQSKEDSNLRWPVATFVRLLRFAAIFISIYFTPLYVASLTFHYEVIPQPLLVPLSESRAIVPFPPILEAIFLELIIELLREAGARLPTKVGQTIGIVGGIVLGTAAVQAGITSNILIIIIALCALSSFTTPNYMMGNVIRVIRFPIILCAGFWGFYGIMLTLCILLVHLLRQTSLGAPFLAPFYPTRLKDWPDSIVRLPMPFISRPTINARQINNKKKKKRA
ncbi:spore germination protein [Ureibacillus sp. NPDC094379]